MSYSNPSKEDVQTLIDFQNALADHFGENPDRSVTTDLIRINFNRYTDPDSYVSQNCRTPPHGVDKELYREATPDKKAQLVRETAREYLQMKMRSSVILSTEHEVDCKNIDGLDQTAKASREFIRQSSSLANSSQEVSLSQY